MQGLWDRQRYPSPGHMYVCILKTDEEFKKKKDEEFKTPLNGEEAVWDWLHNIYVSG